MSEQEINNQIKNLKQQLTLINLYLKDFEKILGKKGTEEFTNMILDKLNLKINQREILRKKNKKS